MELLISAYLMFVVPWVVASWFRLPRYVRYLQAIKYSADEYGLRVTGAKAETRYLQIFITLLVILIVVSCCGSFYLPRIIYQAPVATLLVNLGVLLLAIIFTPRGFQQQARFPFSWRKVRLIIIGFFIELFPTIMSIGLIGSIYASFSDPNNSPESMILAFGFVTLIVLIILIVGPLTFIFTPYAVLLSHHLNRLIELILPKA